MVAVNQVSDTAVMKNNDVGLIGTPKHHPNIYGGLKCSYELLNQLLILGLPVEKETVFMPSKFPRSRDI